MFPNLKAEMARQNITAKDISKKLNISPKSITNKMLGKTEFTRIEIFIIKTTFFPNLSIDYLFECENKNKYKN